MTQEQQSKVQISVHIDAALRDRLEAAAKRAVRSLSGEAAFRLQQSLDESGNASAA